MANVGWGLLAASYLAAIAATSTILSRTQREMDYASLAYVWVPLVFTTLLLLAVRYENQRGRADSLAQESPRQLAVLVLLQVFGVIVYGGALGEAFDTNVSPRAWTLAIWAIWILIVLAMPEPATLPEMMHPATRWMVGHWRLVTLGWCACGILWALLLPTPVTSIMLLSVVGINPSTWTVGTRSSSP